VATESIRKLVDRLLEGEIRVPQFQRGYVWDSPDVAWLMDSLYKQFPIGSILLWKTRERLSKEKNLGPFELPEAKDEGEIYYVLDGQQRLTSLFGVFQTQLAKTMESGSWRDIYFDLRAPQDAVAEQFVALETNEIDASRHFPISTIFDSTAYRAATERFDASDVKRIDHAADVFKETQIPIEIVETKSAKDIAIIFDRINRAGRLLDDFELLAAWTWSDDFDLRDEFLQLASEVEDFGFGEIGGDPNILIKCCTAVVQGSANSADIVELHGPTVRERFDEIRQGVFGAIDFMRAQLNVRSLRVLPYPSMIIPLSCFFATGAKAGIHPTNTQRGELIRWFWRACFGRRYSSSVNTAFAADIKGMNSLRQDETAKISEFRYELDPDLFKNNSFMIGTVATSVFILTLAQRRPLSPLSGAVIDVESVLTLCNRAEFHHVFPKAFLERNGVDRKKIGVLANMCFLSNADNQRIKARAPNEYEELIPAAQHDAILATHSIPADGLRLSYDEFITQRAALLLNAARELVA
jgi:hypothetical protein